jgi:hypothetical protein
MDASASQLRIIRPDSGGLALKKCGFDMDLSADAH